MNRLNRLRQWQIIRVADRRVAEWQSGEVIDATTPTVTPNLRQSVEKPLTQTSHKSIDSKKLFNFLLSYNFVLISERLQNQPSSYVLHTFDDLTRRNLSLICSTNSLIY